MLHFKGLHHRASRAVCMIFKTQQVITFAFTSTEEKSFFKKIIIRKHLCLCMLFENYYFLSKKLSDISNYLLSICLMTYESGLTGSN